MSGDGGSMLRDILTGSPYATAAADRVRANAADPEDVPPYIIFRRTAVHRDWGLDNTLLAMRETFNIECWGETPAKSQELEQQVVTALVAAGIPTNDNDSDGLDPKMQLDVSAVNVDIWT
jgi:hypothetical protein